VSRDKKLQVRTTQEWLDWFDGQIEAHNLDQNRSEIAVMAVEFFFENIGQIDSRWPKDLIRQLDQFIDDSPTKTNRSLVLMTALSDYLIRK